jgi:putative ABC transport system permease protein
MPALAAAIVATIALGVGATSAMFSVVHAVLLRPLPYPNADRLVIVWEKWQVARDLKGIDPAVAARLAERSVVLSTGLETWRRDNHVFEDIAGFNPREFSLTGTAEPERIEGMVATSQLFRVLGCQPALGRAFTADEDRPGRDEVVILSHGLWVRRFGRDPNVLGRTIGIDNLPHTIIGVMPADFDVALPSVARDPQLITPVPHNFQEKRTWTLLLTVARLKPAVTVPTAQADMSRIVRRMAESNPRYKTRDANVVPLAEEMVRDARVSLFVLFGATGVVLLIGCANVANLLLVRAAGRQKELAVRAALGASRWQLTRQMLAESLALAALGGAAGLILAFWGTRVLLAVAPERLFPRMEDISVNPIVLGFGVFISIVAGLAAGLAPVWVTLGGARRGSLNRALIIAERGSSVSRSHRVVRQALVTVQVSLAMVLLIGAGLLTETYVRLTRVDLGVSPDRVLTFGLTLPPARFATVELRVALQEAVAAKLEAVPEVEAVGLTNTLPVQSRFVASMSVAIEGAPASDDREFVEVRTVNPGFFRAAGVRLAYGRLLDARDARAKIAVVNRALVRRYWPSAPATGPEPLGRTLLIGSNWCEIVGVVDDVKYSGPDSRVEKEAYVPLSYWPTGYVSVLVRTSRDPMALVGLARQAVRAVDADLPLQNIEALEDVVASSVAPPRFRFALVGAFALLALVLAVIGLYGVISQSVAHRTREIGIRLALGAARPAVARMVVLEGLRLAVAGVAIGVGISIASTRVLAGFLFGVSATDAPTFVVVGLGIVVLAVAASYGPARRAMRADPAVILRSE